MSNSWDALGINEFIVKGCEQMAQSSVNSKSESYWNTCRDFLESIRDLPYSVLSVKQRNWANSIKYDLSEAGIL